MQLKFFLIEDKELFILHSQYRTRWWAGDTRSQGINSHGFDLAILEYSNVSSMYVHPSGNHKV